MRTIIGVNTTDKCVAVGHHVCSIETLQYLNSCRKYIKIDSRLQRSAAKLIYEAGLSDGQIAWRQSKSQRIAV